MSPKFSHVVGVRCEAVGAPTAVKASGYRSVSILVKYDQGSKGIIAWTRVASTRCPQPLRSRSWRASNVPWRARREAAKVAPIGVVITGSPGRLGAMVPYIDPDLAMATASYAFRWLYGPVCPNPVIEV